MLSTDLEHKIMVEAINEAKKSVSEDLRANPKVGAVLVDQSGKIIAQANRGETGKGDHAEYLLLKKAKASGLNLKKAILFVTLEPCTVRGPDKTSCAQRIKDSGISKVYIGMLDPNPQILGRGETWLRWSNIEVERFPGHLVQEIENLNSDFINTFRASHLPKESLYVKSRISDQICDSLKRDGFDLDNIPSDWDLTVDDLIRYCETACPPDILPQLPQLLHEVRAMAFDKKYANYTYDEDVRGLGDFWLAEIRDILRMLHASDYQRRRVINVGIGNGLEGKGLFDTCNHLTIVDIAKKSIKKAQANLPMATSLISSAEDLNKILAGSQDIYVSLRTYQSAFFNINQAVREAYRIVRQGGVVLISISNGFIGKDGALVPGHIVPNSNIVDRNRPFHLAEKVRQKITLFRFEEIGIRTGLSEIYIYGRRGR